MATFNWEIYEPKDDTVETSQPGGEITIDRVPNIEPDDLGYSINPPNARVKIRREGGGTVHEVLSDGEERPEGQNHRIRLSGTLILYLLLLFLFGYGFVLVVSNDVQSSNLDFKTYMSLITAFLGGLGFANFRKGNNSN